LTVAFAMTLSQASFAQTSAATLPAANVEPTAVESSAASTPTAAAVTAPAASAPEASLSTPFKINAPTFGPYKLRAGIKTTETSARAYEYSEEKGKRYKQKHEYFVGASHTSGWGGYVQAVTSGTTYGDSKKDTLSAGDPSITILHPDYYKGSEVTVSGQFRRYFPVADRSVNRNQRQYAYYLYTTYKLPAKLTVWNQATPRYFDQDTYKTGDTTYYFEDVTNITKSVNSWFSYGAGQWTQVEWHEKAATGTAIDATVFAKFVPMANITIEPRFSLPVHVRNAVYDAAPSVSLNAFRAELYAQIAL